jgi:hypothetical protein
MCSRAKTSTDHAHPLLSYGSDVVDRTAEPPPPAQSSESTLSVRVCVTVLRQASIGRICRCAPTSGSMEGVGADLGV